MCLKMHGGPILCPFIDFKLLNFHALDRRCTLILTRSKRMRRPSTDMMRSAKAYLRVKDWHMCETFGHLSQLFLRAKTVSYAKQHMDKHIDHKLHFLVFVSSKFGESSAKIFSRSGMQSCSFVLHNAIERNYRPTFIGRTDQDCGLSSNF